MLLNLFNINIYYFSISLLFSFFSCFFGLKFLINFFQKKEGYQPIRISINKNEVSVDHSKKMKTPTMGGIAIISSILINLFFFSDIKSAQIITCIIIIFSFAFIGFLDDFNKVFFQNIAGFQGSKKLILQLIFSGFAVLLLIYEDFSYINMPIYIPILNININLGYLSTYFFMLIITGSGNATNITDGLDGLLSMPIILISLSFVFIIFLDLLGIKSLPINLTKNNLISLLILLFSIISCFAVFLKFNFKPARIFMGDIGSLFSGAILCFIAILLKIEFVYAIMALLFICEIFSSVLQVVYFRMTNGKRIFKMAPIHHNLEKNGWSEKKIVFTMWTFTALCCFLGLIVYYYYY